MYSTQASFRSYILPFIKYFHAEGQSLGRRGLKKTVFFLIKDLNFGLKIMTILPQLCFQGLQMKTHEGRGKMCFPLHNQGKVLRGTLSNLFSYKFSLSL